MWAKAFQKLHGQRARKGQAVVEFALTLPLLLVLMCGILDFGWIYVNQYKVEDAAFQGARYGSIYVESQTEAALAAGIETRVRENLPQDGDGVTVEEAVDKTGRKITVTVTYPVKTLTFVAGTFWKNGYQATSTSVSSY